MMLQACCASNLMLFGYGIASVMSYDFHDSYVWLMLPHGLTMICSFVSSLFLKNKMA